MASSFVTAAGIRSRVPQTLSVCVPYGGRFHVLGSDPDPDQPGGDPAQEREVREEPDGERRRELLRAAQDAPDDPILDQ